MDYDDLGFPEEEDEDEEMEDLTADLWDPIEEEDEDVPEEEAEELDEDEGLGRVGADE